MCNVYVCMDVYVKYLQYMKMEWDGMLYTQNVKNEAKIKMCTPKLKIRHCPQCLKQCNIETQTKGNNQD